MMEPPEQSASPSALHLEDVTFAYGKGMPVLQIEQMQVARGESVFVHGPSGSGKTTLLSLIAGVLQPTLGKVHVLGQDLDRTGAAARDRLRGASMGYIFQGFNLIPYLSVSDNIALPCQLHRERRERIRAATLPEEVERLARRLDIHAHLNHRVARLSTGQQQRVAIARALIGSPPLLIADEPTSSLDTNRRDRFLELLQELLHETASDSQRATLLFVSHDGSLARHFGRSLSLPELNLASSASSREDAA